MLKMLTGVLMLAALAACATTEPNPSAEQVQRPQTAPVTAQKSRILTRATWTSNVPDTTQMMPMGKVQLLTVKQAHEPRKRSFVTEQEVAEYLRELREYHVGGKMFKDISFHFAVDEAGHIWQCRPLSYQGSMVRGYNPGNVEIELLSDRQDPIPEAQKQATIWLIEALRSKFAVPITHVYTTSELVVTESGIGFSSFMRAYRQEIFSTSKKATVLGE